MQLESQFRLIKENDDFVFPTSFVPHQELTAAKEPTFLAAPFETLDPSLGSTASKEPVSPTTVPEPLVPPQASTASNEPSFQTPAAEPLVTPDEVVASKGPAVLSAASGPRQLTISEIQGEGHTSAYVGVRVQTTGIVTAVEQSGFWFQSALGDGNAATSDAIYVARSKTEVTVGDALTVIGTVAERSRGSGLTITRINAETVTVESQGNELPDAVVIGEGGVLPPTEVIEDDGMTSYDPTTDGLDFWESLEGMRVTLETPQAISNTNRYGETDLVVSGATGLSDRGALAISEGDWNPEMIQLDDRLFDQPNLSIGDGLESITGILGYGYNHYELVATQTAVIAQDVTLERETTDLAGDANHLTVASYDLSNLDPYDARFASVAQDIVERMQAPDVIAVQRIQDADGQGTGTNLSGQETADRLLDAIFQLTGINYVYVEIAPTEANSTAGQENGNVRNGYFYRPDRVDLVESSLQVIDDPIFQGTRSPLVATWSFNGEEVTTLNVHLTTRYGSDPLWGDVQNPYHAGTIMRTNQIAAIDRWIEERLTADPDGNVMLTGSFGGYLFEPAQRQLTDDGLLTNLATRLAEEERYSRIEDGNAQLIDNTLLSGNLLERAEYDIVHFNSEFAGLGRNGDGDAQVVRFYIPNAPENLRLAGGTVAENAPIGTVVGVLVADDTLNDSLRFALTNDAEGRFVVDAATGVVTTTVALDFEDIAQFAISGVVTDTAGLSATADLTVTVLDRNDAPVAQDDSFAIVEGSVSADLSAFLLSNDSDADGNALTIVSVDVAGTSGRVEFDAASQTLRYFAQGGLIDGLVEGDDLLDTFTYTVMDEGGTTHTARVSVTVDGAIDDLVLRGGNGRDILIGGSGNDRLYGGNGNDILKGEAGNDWLDGGHGNDILTGGAGNDIFLVSKSGGHDFITDFDLGYDALCNPENLWMKWWDTGDVNGDGLYDLTLYFHKGATVTLGGVFGDDRPGLLEASAFVTNLIFTDLLRAEDVGTLGPNDLLEDLTASGMPI
ncbi:hypothetical protein E3U23_05815 [Erythrobacter litoralis]|uniref:Ig-like domain-containing protein n=1 Tax=Erythrobacter litoralis TaxID=39960 RepID=UPI0024360C3F|nr:Ig-like domain-containing protein [Erythrobacter litoralis]MDG6078708.1 hypothetical protein [Erythrobacter litoralis]